MPGPTKTKAEKKKEAAAKAAALAAQEQRGRWDPKGKGGKGDPKGKGKGKGGGKGKEDRRSQTPSGARRPSADPKAKNRICKFHFWGNCKDGPSCQFAHVDKDKAFKAQKEASGIREGSPAPSRGGGGGASTRSPSPSAQKDRNGKEICRLHVAGLCKKGGECKYSHNQPAAPARRRGRGGGGKKTDEEAGSQASNGKK